MCGLLVFIHYTLALPSPANLNPALTFTLALPSAMLYPNPNHINPRNLSSNPSFIPGPRKHYAGHSPAYARGACLSTVLRTPEALAPPVVATPPPPASPSYRPRPSSSRRRRSPRQRESEDGRAERLLSDVGSSSRVRVRVRVVPEAAHGVGRRVMPIVCAPNAWCKTFGTNVKCKTHLFWAHICKTFRCKTLNVKCVANVWQRSPFHQTFCTHEALCVRALDRM